MTLAVVNITVTDESGREAEIRATMSLRGVSEPVGWAGRLGKRDVFIDAVLVQPAPPVAKPMHEHHLRVACDDCGQAFSLEEDHRDDG